MPHSEKAPNPFDPGYFETVELRKFGFKSVGECVRIAKNCTIIGIENIEIGRNVRIDGNVVIAAHSGLLTLGNYIHIGGSAYLGCVGGITLGDFSGISQGVRIYSGTDDYSGKSLTNPTIPRKYLKINIGPVVLEKHVIVGSGSVVLPGVRVGEGSAVGALSLVTKSLGEWGVYFGSPAKRIKSRSKDLLVLEEQMRKENF
ncbi:acyltransferase [Gluconacetobacter takamatsuzukensis]|uniref:Acyltransferase n=1 Tax=Gluconacetobacter takamatsuzukensis TaxID=1286190 RepID=A0A7W4PR65_9PROT|nr:acyltransferase [Gluconacetobacter takamatsuzukensis]MBB2205164.1 acyltransferase [Gluconacetobacter takamatsuzukensis]